MNTRFTSDSVNANQYGGFNLNLAFDFQYCNSLLRKNGGFLDNLWQLVLKTVPEENLFGDICPPQNIIKPQNSGREKSRKESCEKQNFESFKSDSESVDEQNVFKNKLDKDGATIPHQTLSTDFITDSESTKTRKQEDSVSRQNKGKSTVRKDVVFKTILRAIRRHYTTLFKRSYPKFFKKNRSPQWNSAHLKAVTEFIGRTFPNCGDQKTLAYYVLALTHHDVFETCTEIPPNTKTKVEDLYTWLYAFKMWKFKSVSQDPNVKLLLSNMLKDGIEPLFNKEKAMMEKRQVYLEALNEFDNISLNH